MQLSICVLILAAAPVLAAEPSSFDGKVVADTDGDTIRVMHEGVAEKIRLNGIDCPEKGQAFGRKEKDYTASLCFQKQVTVTGHGQERLHVRKILKSSGFDQITSVEILLDMDSEGSRLRGCLLQFAVVCCFTALNPTVCWSTDSIESATRKCISKYNQSCDRVAAWIVKANKINGPGMVDSLPDYQARTELSKNFDTLAGEVVDLGIEATKIPIERREPFNRKLFRIKLGTSILAAALEALDDYQDTGDPAFLTSAKTLANLAGSYKKQL